MEGSETSRDNRAVEKKSNREGKKEEREASISPAVQEAIPNPEEVAEGWAEDVVEERGGDSSASSSPSSSSPTTSPSSSSPPSV